MTELTNNRFKKWSIPTAITALAMLLVLAGQAAALDQTGLSYGTKIGKGAKDAISDTTAVDNRLQKPLTTNVPLTTMDNLKSSTQSTFCGQSTVQNEQQAVQVTVTDAGVITIATDTNGDGNLDSTASYTATKICIDGYQVGLPPTAQYFIWQASGGVITTSPVTALNGCMDPTANPATYVGGSVSQKWADSTGRVITKSSLAGDIVTYYAGTTTDCQGTTTTPSATKYYDNPYTMNDAAIQKTIVCNMNSTDPACRAYASTRAAQTNVSGEAQSGGPCSIERVVTDSNAHVTDTICEPNRIYYPNPYTIDNPTCFKTAGDRWDYNQQFRFKCDPYGKALNLEAWAWWEGAPCGSQQYDFANYPPPIQLTTKLPWSGTSIDTIIGQLDVNRREGNSNLTSVDSMQNNACYNATKPLTVHLAHTCLVDNSSCTYTITVDNAPACGSITYTHTPPPDESIQEDCSTYSKCASGSLALTCSTSCTVDSEIWYDATGGPGVQTIKDGTSVNNQTQVYDQSSPYTPLPTTCKTLPVTGITVCKDWWKITRQYKCESTYNKYQANMGRAATVMETADDNNTSNFTYQKSAFNKENTPKCLLQVKYTSGDIANCYANGLNIKCPLKYQYNSNDLLCVRDPDCHPYTFNTTTKKCQYTPTTPVCSPQYPTYISATNTCQGDPKCDYGTFYDLRNRCETPGNPVCTSQKYTFDAGICKDIDVPCPSNYNFSTTTNKCEPDPSLCPPPGVFHAPPQSTCVNDFNCSPDSYDTALKKCAHPAGKICPTNYSPDNTNNICYIASGDCNTYGTWNPSLGQCSGDKEYLCPPTFDLQLDNTCTKDPPCPNHNNKAITYTNGSGCVAPKENTCSLPYTLNSLGTLCDVDPICPANKGHYVTSTQRCEYDPGEQYLCDVNNINYTAGYPDCLANCHDTQNCLKPFVSGISGINDCCGPPNCTPFSYDICGAGSAINVGPYGTITLAPGSDAQGCVHVTWQMGTPADVFWTGIGNGIAFSYGGGVPLGTITITGLGNLIGQGKQDNGEFCYDSGSMNIVPSNPFAGSNVLEFRSYGDTMPEPPASWWAFGTITSSLGNICPLDSALPCTGSPLKCTKNGNCAPNPNCPPGYQPDGLICVAPGTCPDNQAININTGKCEKTPVPQCLSPYMEIDPTTCRATANCTNGSTVVNDKCTVNATFDCKSPSTWNGTKCTYNATCPGNGKIQNLRCETPFIPDCTMPYIADSTGTKCIIDVPCGGATFDPSTQKCIVYYQRPDPICPDGGSLDYTNHWCTNTATPCTNSSYYDSANNKCWTDARCDGRGSLNTTLHKCTYNPDRCLDRWIYDGQNAICYKEAVCPYGTINYANNRCESYPACEKVFYPEMDCQYQNPTTKINLQCKSNDPLPDCSVALKCPLGGSLNGSICTATASLTCPKPYTLNGSNCITPMPCPESDTGPINIDYTNSQCKTLFGPRCPSGYNLVNGNCQAPTPCNPGTYDAATDKCRYTPPTKYKCSADGVLWDDPGACVTGCKGKLTGGGDFNNTIPGSYTVQGTGSTLYIATVPFNLLGFTANGSTSSMPLIPGTPYYVLIQPRPGNPSLLDVYRYSLDYQSQGLTKTSPVYYTGTITLTGAQASGHLDIDWGAYASDVEGEVHHFDITGAAQTNIWSYEYSKEFAQYCGNPCDQTNMTFTLNAASCTQYTQCQSGWTPTVAPAPPECIMPVPCTNGGHSDPATGMCILTPTMGCPNGYGVVGTDCVVNVACPNLGFPDSTLQACKQDPSVTCPTTDYTVDLGNTCTASAYCPTGGKPSGGTEVSRRVYQKCIDPTQCTQIKCSVQVSDNTYAEGYRTELRNCTQVGTTDQYNCDMSGGPPPPVMEKDCGCITETWNQSLTASNCYQFCHATAEDGTTYITKAIYDPVKTKEWCDQNPTLCTEVTPYFCWGFAGSTFPLNGGHEELCCEPSCTVKTYNETLDTNSVVRNEYTVKNCVNYRGNANAYTCPIDNGETLYQDCGCSDNFGMTASILSAIVESAKDRTCK